MENKSLKDQEDDGFRLVKSKGKKSLNKSINKTASLNLTKLETNEHQQSTELDEEDTINLNKKILDLKHKLKHDDSSFYWCKLQISLRKILKDYFTADQVHQLGSLKLVCYGLGSIDENICSRYQLALLLLIIDEFNEFSIQMESQQKKLSIDFVEFYDPVFNSNDKFLLTELFKFKITNKNEKCFRNVQASLDERKVLNLFYMPHCEKEMYNNLLCSNWTKSCLDSLIIFGNSFNTISTNNLNLLNFSFIEDSCLHLVNETQLNSACDLTNAFTDLAFHVFDQKRLNDEVVLIRLKNKLTLN